MANNALLSTPPLVVNARFLTQRVTGVQRYAIEVSKRLKRLDPTIRFLTPHGVVHAALAKELDAEVVGKSKGHLWEQLELPRLVRGAGLINLCNAAPLVVQRELVTIHDAAPFAVPQAYSRSFRLWYRLMMRGLGFRARRILTGSDFSARELQHHVGVRPERITRIFLSHEHVRDVKSDRQVIDRHGLAASPFLLTVGSSAPHKNFKTLARALEQLGNTWFRTVIVGGANLKVHASGSTWQFPASVQHVGAVSDGELRALYENAAGYIHPAYYEGFGLPPLEALSLGCPVICSNAGSLPEVCGEAALYFDPHDVDDMVAKIGRFMEDAPLREELRNRGRAQAARFSWDDCAWQILQVARDVLR